MKLLSQVVWSEGMYLSPIHFQAQSRYFEDSLDFLRSQLWTDGWGFSHLVLDPEAIRNGKVLLLGASGIFPDGLAFDIPSSAPPPESRSLADVFTPMDSELALHLAVPALHAGAQNCVLSGPEDRIRYFADSHVTRDETSTDERELLFAQQNLRILTSAELTDDLISLPLTRVVRDRHGAFTFDPEFIPPSLHLGAAETTLLLVKRLLESMQEKLATLTPARSAGGRFEAGSSALDVASYWFLHSIVSAIPGLRHCLANPRMHPERLYTELSRLAGALCTFVTGSDPMDLPAYDHLHPEPVFRALDRHIRRHLDVVVPTSYVALKFADAAPYIREADVVDERCLRRSRWIFGIRSSLGEADLIHATPRLIKVCSARFVPELVRRALPGLSLTHLPVPPSALRADADRQYFSVDLSGPCWEHIQQTRRVGVYVPGEIAGADFDLNIIVEPTA